MPSSRALIAQARRGGLTDAEQNLKDQWVEVGTAVLKELESELSGVSLTSLALVHKILSQWLTEHNLSEVRVVEASPVSATDAYSLGTFILGNPTEKASVNLHVRIEEGVLKAFISLGG